MGGTGSFNSAGNIQLYVGAGGGGITLDKAGVWELYCYNNSIRYSLMKIEVYPAVTQADVVAAKVFDETVKALPNADQVTLDDEDAILAAVAQYEALSPAALTFITEEEKYIAAKALYQNKQYSVIVYTKSYYNAVAIIIFSSKLLVLEYGSQCIHSIFNHKMCAPAQRIYRNISVTWTYQM